MNLSWFGKFTNILTFSVSILYLTWSYALWWRILFKLLNKKPKWTEGLHTKLNHMLCLHTGKLKRSSSSLLAWLRKSLGTNGKAPNRLKSYMKFSLSAMTHKVQLIFLSWEKIILWRYMNPLKCHWLTSIVHDNSKT